MQIFVEISITVLKRLHLSDRKKIYVCQYLFMVRCQIFLDSTKIYIGCIYYLVAISDTVACMKYELLEDVEEQWSTRNKVEYNLKTFNIFTYLKGVTGILHFAIIQ